MLSRSAFLRALAIPAIILVYVAVTKFLDLHQYKQAATLCLYFSLLVCAASLTRHKWRDGFLILSSLVFGLFLIEAGAASVQSSPIHIFSKGLFGHHSILGTGADPGVLSSKKIDPQSGATIYDVTYTVDADFLRHTDSNDNGPTVAFFGDSMTFGEGVNDAQTMPQAFADLTDPGFKVVNFGSSGFGPHQYLRALESGMYDDLLAKDLRLIAYMTSPFHAERVACKPSFTLTSPRYELVNGVPQFKGACAEGLSLQFKQWLTQTATYRTFIERVHDRVTHDDIELYIATILKAISLGKEKYNAPSVILFLASPANYLSGTGFTDEEIVGRLKAGGATVIDVGLGSEADQASLKIQGDGHPTPLAHRLRAALLKQFLVEKMPDVLAKERISGNPELQMSHTEPLTAH